MLCFALAKTIFSYFSSFFWESLDILTGIVCLVVAREGGNTHELENLVKYSNSILKQFVMSFPIY